jgi:hypothetical protein
LPPDIKYKKYAELLNKFGTVMKNVTQPFEIEIKPKLTDTAVLQHGETVTPNQKPETSKESQVLLNKEKEGAKIEQHAKRPISGQLKQTLEILRGPEKTKAMEILKTLENDPRIKWDDEGKIYFKDKFIKGSDISETLNDLTKIRKKINPGFTEVSVVLLKNRIP